MKQWRIRLNAGFSGPQCWLLLAIRRGWLKEAGIALGLEPGQGAWTAAAAMDEGGHDLGYGDIHALAEIAMRRPAGTARGVYATFAASAAAIALPIGASEAVAGRRLIGHASDVGLRLFPAFCAAQRLDPAATRVIPAEGSMVALWDRVRAGEADGLFAYVSTLTAALAAAGRDAAGEITWLRYDEGAPDLHGSALMASARLIAEEPEALARLLAVLDRGMEAALDDPDEAMDAVLSFAPAANRAAERVRWQTTLAVEMAGRGSFGGISPGRFGRGLALQAGAAGLPAPRIEDVFTDRFLPPPETRTQRPVAA